MKNLIAFFFLFFLLDASAQDKISVGIYLSPDITGQTNAPYTSFKTKPGLGYTGGLEVKLFPFKNIGLFAGINKFRKSYYLGMKEIRVVDENDPVYIAFKDNDNYFKKSTKEDYMEPVAGLLLRTTPKKLSVYGSFGLSYAMILKQYDVLSNKEYYRKDVELSVYNKNFVNGLAGIGITVYASSRLKLEAEAKFRYAFTDVLNHGKISGDSFYNQNVKTYAAGLKIGVAYVLLK